jgi:hypothetical protein
LVTQSKSDLIPFPHFQLQEYEIENAKLKEDLKKLRESIADGYGKDSQIREIMGNLF